MTDRNKDPSSDILRNISEAHEDQPGDLGKTVTERDAPPDEDPRNASR